MDRTARIIKHTIPHVLAVGFTLLVIIVPAYVSVSRVIQNRILENSREALRGDEEAIRAGFFQSELILMNGAAAVQGMIDRGQGRQDVLNYLRDTTGWMRRAADGFYGLYGYVENEFFDAEEGSPIKDDAPWRGAAENAGVEPVYTAPYWKGSIRKTVVSVARNLYDGGGTRRGVLVVDVDFSRISNRFHGRTEARGSLGMIADQDMNLLSHTETTNIGRNIRDLGGGFGRLADAPLGIGETAVTRIAGASGDPVIVVTQRIFNGWYIARINTEPLYYEEVYRIGRNLLLLSLVLLLILGTVIYRINIQSIKAGDASRYKSAFLANVSHEIRTPLNAIIGLSEVELGKNTGPRSETMDNLENIYSSGTTLLGIVNDILDASKIESGRMELVPVEYALSNMINDAVSLNVVRIGSKPITFELVIDETVPAVLYGDELRVRQILNNLLSNAIKYTQKGRVVLDIGYEREGDHIRLICAVKDTGIGIRPKDMEKLFSEYNQVDTRSNRAIEGTGLGLAITKNLVEMMAGSISVESEYGKGSVFTVRVLQKIADEEPLGRETAENLKNFRFRGRNREAQNLVRKPIPYARVLVVDDVVTNLAVARGMMAPYGMIIDGVTSGRMAVDFLRKENVRYDAVFMDHMMPGMDGIEAVRIIRNEIGTEYARNIPIIALTANAMVGSDRMFLENGFQAFLSKPINALALDNILNEWVRDPVRDAVLTEKPSVPPPVPPGNSPASPRGPLPPGLSPPGPLSPGLSPPALLDAADPLRRLEPAGIDAEAALRRLNGNREAYVEILRAFARHTPAQLDSVRRCTADTLEDYAIRVHGLKGANYGIGAGRAGKAAAELEASALAGWFEVVQEKNPPFIGAMETLIAEVKAVMPSLRSGAEEGPKPRRAEPDGALLAGLLDACKSYDMETMERILSDLEEYAYESGGDLVDRLREDLDNLEYDAIRERLEGRDRLR
ncbi:MAG: response regulator [Treponema sp.]|jgi:signal transduction histidine kinase/CheY-like chemotaxis protein|nr:response regulator [Treponema sp.]